MQLMTKAKIELISVTCEHQRGDEIIVITTISALSLTILTSNNHALVFPDTIVWFLWHIWWPDKSFLMVTNTNESLSRCSGVMQGENPVLTLIKAIPAMASNLKSCLMNQWCRGGVRDNLPTGWRIFSEDQLKCFEFTGRYNTQLPRSKYLLEYWIWEILVFIDKHCGYNL